MKETKSHRLSTPALAAIAALLGVLAGAAWIYGMGGVSGNGQPETTAVAGAPAGDRAACETDRAMLAALKPLARGEVAALAVQDEPRPLPELVFKDETDRAMRLSDLSGKPLLVNIWATWCAPCRAEMPALSRLKAEMGGDGFDVVTINIDTGDRTKPEAFLSEIGVGNLALYRDETMGVFNRLKKEGLAFGLPATLLVAKDGCLVGVMNGPAEWASEDAKALIGVLAGPQAPPDA